MKSFVNIFIFIFVIQIGSAQTQVYQHFGVDEGLPSSEVYDVYQDKQGYIWFATDKGVSRYNGYEFENFTTKDGLPDNTILDFYPQNNGQIWCYGFNSRKLFYFNEVFNGFKEYEYNHLLRERIISKALVKSVYLKDDNTLQVSGYAIPGFIEISSNGNLSHKFGRNTVVRRTKIKIATKLNDNFFFLLHNDYENPGSETKFIDVDNNPTSRVDIRCLSSEHTVFIDYKLGVLSKDGKIKYYETEQNPIGVKRVSDTVFFVGYYSNGAEIRDVTGNVLETFLPQKSVSSFLIDAEGGYWFTTINDGVYYVKNPNFKVFTNEQAISLVKSDKNTLYAAFDNGNIAKIGKNKVEILYKGSNDHNAFVEFDKNKKQLYAYSDYLLENYSTNKKMEVFSNKLPEEIASPLLTASTSYFSKIKEGKTKTYKSDQKIQDVCFFNDTIFIGTSSGLFVQAKDSIVKYQPKHLLKARIDDIDVNNNTHILYMATQGNGVVVYNDTIYNITKEDGLINDVISEIHIENDTIIWACSNSGLNRIIFTSDDKYNISTLTKSEGLISNDVNDIEIINDTVWVATKKGLTYFNKKVLDEKASSKVLSLQLKEVLVNNLVIDTSVVNFKYNQNSIGFKLQAVSSKNSNQINYQYRLKEVDTTWQNTKNRLINFPSLSAGSYTFQAKANLLNQPKDYIINYKFTILPPFWKSWWFSILCVLALTGLVYLFFRIRILTYNKDVFRELIRLAIKQLKRKERYYNFRANGEDFKVPTSEIQYINSQGNYLDIITQKKIYTIRCKIGEFIKTTPDALEYLRVHRSYIVRIDKVTSKGKKWVVVNDKKIPVGETYLKELAKIQF